MKKYLFVIAVLFTALSATAQTEQLSGKVTDAISGAPVSGATVKLSAGHKAITGTDGYFSIDCKEAGKLSVSHLGYVSSVKTINSCNETVDVLLQPSADALDEVEITASSNSNKKLLYQPTSIVKLQETELKRATGLFLDDAINANVPGVSMQRRTVSAGQQFNIRGYGNGARGTNGVNSNFDGQGYKVYLNGIPVTDAEGITLMDDIDFGSVNNVEVTKGPSGSLYGLAIAGVVNLKTVKAEKNKVVVGQDALLGSYGLQRYTTHVQLGGERSSFLINYGKQLYDGFMPHTSSHKDFVNAIGEFQPNSKQTVNMYAGYSNSYDQRNGEITIKQYDSLNYGGNPAYIANNAHSGVTSFRAGLSHTYQFNDHISNTSSVFGSGIASNVSSAGGWTDKLPVNYGLRSTFDTKWSLGKDYSLSGITGIEAQRQNAQTMAYNMVKDSFNLSGYNIIGAMRSNQYTISSTYSIFTDWTLAMPNDFNVIAGIGMSSMSIDLNDRFYVASNNNPSNASGTHNPSRYKATYNDMYSPHIAFNKVIGKQVSLYASFSKAYKAPVSSYFFIPLTGQVNRSLKPEEGTQFEMGSKGNLLKGKLYYEVALFNAMFMNKMTVVAVPNAANTATSYTYVANGGTQDSKGLEVLVKYVAYKSSSAVVSNVAPFANLAWSDFQYKDFKFQQLSTDKKGITTADFSGNKVAGVPPLVVNAGCDAATRFGLYGNVTYSYRDGMFFTSDQKNKTTSYNLLNAKLGYQRTVFKHLGFDAFFGVNNITGVQYPFMVFLNQLPDAYLPAPREANFFGGLNLKYTF